METMCLLRIGSFMVHFSEYLHTFHSGLLYGELHWWVFNLIICGKKKSIFAVSLLVKVDNHLGVCAL
jgi:hypothetical protein